jgi:hypothetical protein
MPDVKMTDSYRDFALVLAWPNVTARGDERWYMWLKKMGIVKNLNFKVGHAAIVLIHSSTGTCHYYDFGRYITPRGCGRARSADTDPDLRLETICDIRQNGKYSHIVNIKSLLHELHEKRVFTHGDDDMYASVAAGIHIMRAKAYADSQCVVGAVCYSAFAKKNNNCSRFVERILKAGFAPDSIEHWQVARPETFVASPISNVINARKDHQVIRYRGEEPVLFSMNRLRSLQFFLRQVSANFFWGDYATLSDDSNPGYQSEPAMRPSSVPPHAQWLGGIGEGAWHEVASDNENRLIFRRYSLRGEIDIFRVIFQTEGPKFNSSEHFSFEYNTHASKVNLRQHGCLLTFAVLSETESSLKTVIHYAS